VHRKDKHASEIGFTNKEAFKRSFTKEEMEAHFIKEWERGVKLCCGLPNLFPDALAYLMDKTCITNEDLADKAWLDVRTIQRLRTDVEQNPTLTTVVKICLALELPMAVSEIMVRKAGREFRVGTVDMAYHHLLTWCVGYDLLECNKIIGSMNKKYPLFKQQKKK
jgi:DNA-binding Xre family transcriptional regulator